MENLDIYLQQQGLKALGFDPGPCDGTLGPRTQSARSAWAASLSQNVLASSFADSRDIAAFKRAKARGMSDQEAFFYGDNGIGKWGDDTTVEIPMCALPPEDWKPLGTAARGAKVIVCANGREILCELRDTMPALRNVKNGAGIDLNPAAVKALGLAPPIMIAATWRWLTA